MFAERLAGHSVARITRALNDAGIPCPSAADPKRNPHRMGAAWTLATVASILANPRYTGRQVWNRQRTDADLVDPANTGLGHKQVQRWNLPAGWVISARPAHPAIVSEADYIAAQDASAPRGPAGPATRRYLLAGLLVCGGCGRRLESAWSNGKPAYRCRHGYTSATGPEPGRPKNLYVRGFTLQGPLNWSDTAPALRTLILDQIIDLGSIDEYEIKSALSELSVLDPLGVARLLMRRIDRQTSLQSLAYEALPYHWDPALRIQQTTELAQCLVEVRDWMTHRSHDPTRYPLEDHGAELYQLVAGDWNDQALATLTDFGDAPTEAALITAARILAHAPVMVLFAQVPLISKLLYQAESLGKNSTELVSKRSHDKRCHH